MRRVLREPLVHFLLLGGLLFAWYAWRGGAGGPGSDRIVVGRGLMDHLAAGFSRTWQRPPTAAELKGLLDDWVKEEIATREAMAMGLDRDDTVIRRRLRQKLEFLVEDTAGAAAPSDDELAAWMRRHPDAFRIDAQLAFRQVYVSPDRRGASARSDAEALLARLRAAGPDAPIDGMGDASMLPAEPPLGPLRDVARTFGDEFAQALLTLEPRRWTGPLESPYGLHVVLVRERVDAAAPDLATVRPLVEREVLAERRRTELERLYERLLQKYMVTVAEPEAAPARTAAPGGEGPR